MNCIEELRAFGPQFSKPKRFWSRNSDVEQVYIDNIVIRRKKRDYHTQSIGEVANQKLLASPLSSLPLIKEIPPLKLL